jgi:hypothetical protein
MTATEITGIFGGIALVIGAIGKILLDRRHEVLKENKDLKKKVKALEASNTRLKKLLK